MTWLLYNVCALLTLGKISIKSFKLLKSKDDETLAGRDLLICWTIYMVIVGWETCGVEYFIKWFPGYYYVKSCMLIIVAWPQLRLGRVVFFDFIKPWVEYIDQQLSDLNVRSPVQAFEIIPLFILALIFPKLSETSEPSLSSEELYNDNINIKLKSTSKKLSILTEYLDELELRSSSVKHKKKEEVFLDVDDVYLPRNDGSQTIFARLNIFSRSPTKAPLSPSSIGGEDISASFASPRHNRRRSLEMLQNILQKQASTTLEFFKFDQRSSRSSDAAGAGRSESRERSQSRGRGERQPSPRSRARRPSTENLLLMDPMEISKNVTTRRQLRSAMARGPPTVFQMPQNLFDVSSTSSSSSARVTRQTHDNSLNIRSRFSMARNSIGKDIDGILKGIRRPSQRLSTSQLEMIRADAKSTSSLDKELKESDTLGVAEAKSDYRRFSLRSSSAKNVLDAKDTSSHQSSRYSTPTRK